MCKANYTSVNSAISSGSMVHVAKPMRATFKRSVPMLASLYFSAIRVSSACIVAVTLSSEVCEEEAEHSLATVACIVSLL